MKKALALLTLMTFLLILPAGVLAHTEADPFVADLLAGQYIYAGDLLVWNDGDNLYVKYELDGWCMSETHIHVADSLDGIPQTKKGNPIPGKFDHKMEHNPCVTESTYIIPLGDWEPDTELYIAAHAAMDEVQAMTIVSNAGDTVFGPRPFRLRLNSILWGSARDAVVAFNPLSSPWDWGDDTLPGARWISTAESTERPCINSWRKFTETFEVPGVPVSGMLYVNADNEFWAYLGDTFIGTDDQIFDGGNSSTGVEKYSFMPTAGENNLQFIVKNWAQCSGNPNGLVYKAEITYLSEDESAWAAGSDFPGKNWATYLTYTVQEASEGPTVTPGPPAWTRGAGVRYKGYNPGKEIFLGPMTSGSATPRVETEYNEFMTVVQKTYQITFDFDKDANAISTLITSPDASLTFDFDDPDSDPGCPAIDWDAMEILVRDSRTDSGAALENVTLDSFDLGNFATVEKGGTPGWQNWTVTGFDFSQSFTVTADLVVDGYIGSEAIKVEFNVGCLTP
jgi:hypothetical protein